MFGLARLRVTALVPGVYVRPVENVVVAELNFEKSAAVTQPLTEAVADVQSNVPATPPRNDPSVPLYVIGAVTVGVVVPTVLVKPFVPVKSTPCDRAGKYRLLLNVDDAVENSPPLPMNPIVVVVELYPELDVNGKGALVFRVV